MTKRMLGVVLTSVTVAAAASPAAAGAAAPNKRTVKVISGASFVPNRFIKEILRYDRDVYRIKSGGTVTLKDKSDDIHTLTIARKSDYPKTVKGLDKCFEVFCGQIFGLHAFAENPEGPPGPPANPLLNRGIDGFNRRGDSIVLLPGGKTSFKVTAAKGTKLRFMCILHPQMQARFSVK